MKIKKYPAEINGEVFTAIISFRTEKLSGVAYMECMLYKGKKKFFQKPDFTYRTSIPANVIISKAEEMKAEFEKG